METECPYCGARVDVTRVARHVQLASDEDHGPHGTTPNSGVDNPWNLRLAFSDDGSDANRDAASRAVEIKDEVRRGRCPACALGVMALKGGSGFLSSGRRRLACPSCGWETPEWVEIR
jgi:DNA-directed RNA polymerase subunit RPC12/RpoP